MKRNLARNILMSVLTGAVLMSSNVVWAAVTTAPSENDSAWIKYETNNSDEGNQNTNGEPPYYPSNQNGNNKHIVFGNEITTDSNFASAFSDNRGKDYIGLKESSYGNIKINGGVYKSTSICGGYFFGNNPKANNNSVMINGGEFEPNIINININASLDNYPSYYLQNLIIQGGTASFGLLGRPEGQSYDGNSELKQSGGIQTGESNYNSILIKGGIFNSNGSLMIRSGEVVTMRSNDDKAMVKHNSIIIENGKFVGNSFTIQGGFVVTSQGFADVSNNLVEISGGDFNIGQRIDIYGGFVNGLVGMPDLSKVTVQNNCVSIRNVQNLDKANLYGGIVGGQAIYGGSNTLNLGDSQKMWSGKVASIQGFDIINFERIDWVKDDIVIETGSLGVKNTQIKVNTVFVKGDTTLSNSDKMTLIQANAIEGTIAGDEDGGNVTGDEKVIIYQGVAETIEANVKQNENSIYLELNVPSDSIKVTEDSTIAPSGGTASGSSLNEQVLVIGESRTAATAFTNQGSELIETGLDALARDKSESDTKVFASVYGNTSEYATGSHVKVNGWSGIVGVGKTNANGLTVGAFFENGEGNFRTYNDINGMFMRGDGEACYNGGGFFVRKDNANGVYTEASLRAGNLQNELRNAVIGSEGLTGYDIDTFYYGAHIGVGKIIPRGNDGDSLDVYGKFIYTHHDSEDFTINGSDFHFDSIDSERLRLGFRLNEVQNDKLTMYYGAAWEYEFNGDPLDKAASFDLETPTLDGSTVIGEVGVHYKASEKWSLDLNARAYGGQREGFSGSLQANYNF